MRAKFIPVDFYQLPLISSVTLGLALEITSFHGFALHCYTCFCGIILVCCIYHLFFLLGGGSTNCA